MEDDAHTVAKIQYFYDVMSERVRNYEDAAIGALGDLDEMQYRAILVEINYLQGQYLETFSKLIYTDPKSE